MSTATAPPQAGRTAYIASVHSTLAQIETRLGRPLSDDEIVGHIEDRRKASKEFFSPERTYKWPRHWHFAFGRQWISFNPGARRWVSRTLTAIRQQTVNLILPKLNHMVAKLMSANPHFSCNPAREGDPQSLRSAEVCTILLDRLWRTLHLTHKRYFALIYMFLFGSGFLRIWWDHLGGEMVPRQIDPDQGVGLDGEEVGGPQWSTIEPEGELKVDVCHPADVHLPPGTVWPLLDRSVPWLIHDLRLTPEEIWERYGVEVNAEVETDVNGFDENLAIDVDRFTFGRPTYSKAVTGRCLVHEYTELRSASMGWEEGQTIVIAGGRLLKRDPQQLGGRQYQFFQFSWTPEPSRGYAHAPIEDMIEPQVSFNKKKTRISTWEAMCFFPRILNPASSGIPDSHFRSGGFTILNYQLGKPDFWTPDPPPAQAWQSIEQDKSDLEEVAAQYGFARGQPQTGRPSGDLAQTMIEADATEYGPALSLHARVWGEFGSALLELLRRNARESELVRVGGPQVGGAVRTFKGSDIPSDILCEVQEDSLQPKLTGARIAKVERLLNMGMYGDVATDTRSRANLLEYMGSPQRGQARPVEALERDLSLEECFVLLHEQQPVQRRQTDNDQVHIEAMLERAARKDSMAWPPEAWARFMAHFEEHQTAITEQQEKAKADALETAKQQSLVDIEGKMALAEQAHEFELQMAMTEGVRKAAEEKQKPAATGPGGQFPPKQQPKGQS